MMTLFFTEPQVKDFADATRSDTDRHAAFCLEMLQRGVYLAPSQFEALFISAAPHRPRRGKDHRGRSGKFGKGLRFLMPEIRVAETEAVPEGKGIVVNVEGKQLAIFRYQGEFFALDETCPHRGGPLHEGLIQEGVVACPWHLWQFNLKTGLSPVNPLSKVQTYKTRVEGNNVLAEIPLVNGNQ